MAQVQERIQNRAPEKRFQRQFLGIILGVTALTRLNLHRDLHSQVDIRNRNFAKLYALECPALEVLTLGMSRIIQQLLSCEFHMGILAGEE